jgi:hypothetical protein
MRPHVRRQPLTDIHPDIDIFVRFCSLLARPLDDLFALRPQSPQLAQ